MHDPETCHRTTPDLCNTIGGLALRCCTGDNLLHLFGLPVDSRVLILGNSLAGWRGTFRDSYFQHAFNGYKLCSGTYDLILYHTECASMRCEFSDHLEQLRKLTAANGLLMLFAENFYSFNNLKRLWGGRGRDVVGKLRFSCDGFHREIGRKGFIRRPVFLSLPGLTSPEEMIAPNSSLVEVSHQWHPLLRLAHHLGCFQALADGYVFLCSSRSLEESPLLRAVAAKLVSLGSLAPRLSLERFDLRLRGAMVLFIREETSGKYYIVRVVSDPGTREIICGNQDFLKDLRSLPGLSAELKSVMPVPLGNLVQNDATFYLETMLPGSLAWKVSKGRFRHRIYQESVDFIVKFNLASRSLIRLDEVVLGRLFSEDLQRLERCPTAESELQAEALALVRRICRLLHGRSIYLVQAHGDYGYGNILVDPCSGRMAGVIDWDTGLQREFAGLDFLNLEIQKARIENKWELFPAFVAVSKAMIARDGLDLAGSYRDEFGIEGELVHILLAIALVRYLSRAAQYPEVFASEQGDYRNSLDFVKCMLEAIQD